MNLPNVHEHVAEEAPHLCTVAGMVDQRALHEVGLIGLQYPLVQHDAIAHEHDDLQQRHRDDTKPSVLADTTIPRSLCGLLVQKSGNCPAKQNPLCFIKDT